MTETKRYRWNDLEVEQVSDAMRRRLVSGERIMLAQVLLSKGALIPRHQHVHEQMAYIVAGRLRFKVGDGNEELTVGAGEVLHFPSNVWHEAEVLEDSVVLDVFSPPREDWIQRTDAYLRR